MEIPSKLLEEVVEHFASLPGICRKTALRLALNLLQKDEGSLERFGESLKSLKSRINYCTVCHNISETEMCSICSNSKRDKSTICVVEDLRDVIAIESTQQYFGTYHVLGGCISPIDGIGPDQLTISQLEKRVASGGIKEIILALTSTMEGDTTSFYLYKKLDSDELQITSLARGVPIGNELEFTDEITLGRSLLQRVPYKNNFSNNT